MTAQLGDFKGFVGQSVKVASKLIRCKVVARKGASRTVQLPPGVRVLHCAMSGLSVQEKNHRIDPDISMMPTA